VPSRRKRDGRGPGTRCVGCGIENVWTDTWGGGVEDAHLIDEVMEGEERIHT
jgi:hypothetical protein